MYRVPWIVKVTHIPTGIEVVRGGSKFRNQHLARASALRYLRSRLYLLAHNLEDFKIEEVANEELL